MQQLDQFVVDLGRRAPHDARDHARQYPLGDLSDENEGYRNDDGLQINVRAEQPDRSIDLRGDLVQCAG